MRLSVLGVGSKNSPKTRKNTPKWVKISIFFPKSPQNPPENGFGGGSGQFSALISGKTSKIVVKFRGGGVLRIDPYNHSSFGHSFQKILKVVWSTPWERHVSTLQKNFKKMNASPTLDTRKP